jgi:hypothetical protein
VVAALSPHLATRQLQPAQPRSEDPLLLALLGPCCCLLLLHGAPTALLVAGARRQRDHRRGQLLAPEGAQQLVAAQVEDTEGAELGELAEEEAVRLKGAGLGLGVT